MSVDLQAYLDSLVTVTWLMEQFDKSDEQVRYAIKQAEVKPIAKFKGAAIYSKSDVPKIVNQFKGKR